MLIGPINLTDFQNPILHLAPVDDRANLLHSLKETNFSKIPRVTRPNIFTILEPYHPLNDTSEIHNPKETKLERTSRPVGLSFHGLDALCLSLKPLTKNGEKENNKHLSLLLRGYKH